MSNLKSLRLYRLLLQRSKKLSEAPQRQEALWKTKRYFRDNRDETDLEKIETLQKEGESKLQYMLALIPTHSISLEDRLGEPPKNRQAMAHRNYIFDNNGNLAPGLAKVIGKAQHSNWGDGNFDPDWIAKWKAQNDRIMFKGPIWDAYRKGHNPYREMAKGPRLLDYVMDPTKYESEVDWDRPMKYKDENEADNFRHFRRSDFPGLSDEGHDYAPDYELQKRWKKKYPGDHKPLDMTQEQWKQAWKNAETEPDPHDEIDFSGVPDDTKEVFTTGVTKRSKKKQRKE